jgi:hypothetical protein
MERILTLTTFEQEEAENPALQYWLSRPPEERIAEIERLRREYMENLGGAERHGLTEGLRGPLLLVDREEC